MSVQTDEQPRVLTGCDGCGGTDALPKHHTVVQAPEGGLAAVSLHIGCCAVAGCPDGSCDRAAGVS